MEEVSAGRAIESMPTADSPSPLTHIALDSMSNIPVVPENIVHALNMRQRTLRTPVSFGAVSHDGSVIVNQVASSINNPFLPAFYVAPSGYMSIFPTSYLSRMGYEMIIYPHERGFAIINGHGEKVFQGPQHSNKFHYVTWEFMNLLQPTTDLVTEDSDIEDWVTDVCHELDKINAAASTSNSNSTAKNNSIDAAFVRMMREAHTRMGHMPPPKMAHVIANGLRSDLPPYTAHQLNKVMERWPCIYCQAATTRKKSRSTGSGVEPAVPFQCWSVDNKDGYVPCIYWGYTGYYIFEDYSTSFLYVVGHKNHDGAHMEGAINDLVTRCRAQRHVIRHFVTDAGSVETSKAVRDSTAKIHNATIDSVPPKMQHRNKVERAIQTIDNHLGATIASTVQGSGSVLGDAVWYSALMTVVMSHNCQVHHDRMVTAYEEFNHVPPNMDELMPFRLGTLVTLTSIKDKRAKQSHDLRSTPGFCLHSQHDWGGHKTWVWLPSMNTALLRGYQDIHPQTYPGIPNQSIVVHEGSIAQGNKTYPHSCIMKLIDDHIDADGVLAAPTGQASKPVDVVTMELDRPVELSLDKATLQVQTAKCPSIPADAFINRTVKKYFKGHGTYVGTVVSFKYPYYKVHYEDDNDYEEYTRAELLRILVPVDVSCNTIEGLDTLSNATATAFKKKVSFNLDSADTSKAKCDDTGEARHRSGEFFSVKEAYAEDLAGWKPVVDTLLEDCMLNIKSIKLVSAVDVPNDALILPATILCKYKVDTKTTGIHWIKYARMVVQDSKKRRAVDPSDVWAAVARAKTVRTIINIAAHFRLQHRCYDVARAFPSTVLADEFKGKVFLRLPSILGLGDGMMAEMLTCIEGFQPSNHAFDVNIRKGLEGYGFRMCPSDEQLITRESSDGNFIVAGKVVDNFIVVSTNKFLEERLLEAVQSVGYKITREADDKFIGLQICRMLNGEIHVHQGPFARSLAIKYGINAHVTTPLSTTFSGEDYVASGKSEAIDIKTYQTIVGDIAYLTMTRFEVLYPLSAVSQKTHYCSVLDYAEAIRIVQYISANPDQALIFYPGPHSPRHPTHQLLDVPVSIFLSADSSHRKAGRPEEARDQIGYFVKVFSVHNGAIQAVSRVKDTTMSSAEAEISAAVPAICDGLDTYFVLNHIGFRNIGQLILEGDNKSSESLCTLPGSTTRKRSRHFVGSSSWIKQFYDRYLLWLVHTPSSDLASNALTKRVAEDEQRWTSDDMRGCRHRRTEVDTLPHEPIMRSDHMDMWPVVPCSTTRDYR